MQNKVFLLTLLCLSSVATVQLTNNDAVFIAQINLNLPNTKFDMGNGNYIKLFNGVMVDHKGPFVSASLSPKILNGDFNNDGYADAAVILYVVYDGIGYFNNIVFVVLQDYANGPKVTNGVVVGEIATYTVDAFSTNVDNNKIILQFMDRLPGQPKAVAPSVPTVQVLSVNSGVLSIESEKTFDKSCYPF